LKILHGLAGGAFSEIVKARDEDQAASRVVQRESDIAKICVRDVLQLRQAAGGPDAHHRPASVEPAIERFDVRGSLRFGEGDVDGRKNAARKRQQMGGKK